MRLFVTLAVLSLCPLLQMMAAEVAPISPAEAAKKVNEKVTVEMFVKSIGGRDTQYLNSEEDYKTASNFTIAIPKDTLPKFKKAGIENPGAHFNGKTIRVTGTVLLNADRPRITIEETDQITVAEKEKK